MSQYVHSVLAPRGSILISKIGMRIAALLRDGVLRGCGNGTSCGTSSAAAKTGEALHTILANLSANLIHVDYTLFKMRWHCAVNVGKKSETIDVISACV